jgi:regulator of protease activity HflC (stomatin/prohibitin superfamily)
VITQLLQFLANFWRQLAFWAVLDSEQVGFIRRVGVPAREMAPGWNWKWPVLESAEVEDSREYCVCTDPQSLVCKDGVAVVVRLTATCNVYDAQKYLLEVCDGRTNIQDLLVGELSWLVQRRPSEVVLSGKMMPDLERRAAKAARKWGIHVASVRVLDAARARSVRLWQSTLTSSGQE